MGLTSNLSAYGTTIYGVQACDEETQEEFLRFGRSRATRQIVCGWTDRITLINNIAASAGLDIGNQYFFTPAVPYPDAPNLLYFSHITTEGIPVGGLNTGPNDLVGYSLARCKIEYESQPYLEVDQGVLAVDYATQDLAYSSRTVTWHYDTSTGPGVDPSQIPAITGTFVTWTWTQFNMISIPNSTIRGAAANPIDTSGLFGTAAGTLMFQGAKSTRRMGITGTEMWDMTITLLENPFGWNKAFMGSNIHTGDDTFHNIVNGHGNPPYGLDTGGNIPALVPNSSF